MKVRAAVLQEFGQPLVVEQVELAEPKAGEALVRLEACGVCHTDLYAASGADPTGYTDCVLGHEGAGIVEQVGPGVTLVSPGDHVVTLFAPECGKCAHCRSPRTNRCVAIRDQQGVGLLPDGTTRFARNGVPLRHFMGTSTFAEHTVVPEIALAKVNPEAPLDGCAPFACGLSTGLGAVIGCQLAGAERIIAIDLSDSRLAEARRHGATDVRVADDETVEWVRSETGGFGADYTFEATGDVGVMQQAVEAAREAWGQATMIGVAGKGETLDIVPRLLITGRRVTGSSFGGVKGRTQVPELVERWLAGEFEAAALVTAKMPLDDVNDAFAAMERQEGIRTVLTFD